jgi:hypothetical protein
MEIIKTNIDLNNKKLVYKLTKSTGYMVQEAADRLSVPISAWALYNDPKENKDGTVRDNKVLSFLSADGAKYSTVSATFIREFLEIAEIMGEDAYSILIVHGTTKGGKPFCTCELDCDF